jgi:nucleoid DNA-binding protein
MNKQDLVVKIADDVGVTRSTALEMVDAFLGQVTRALKKGDTVTFVGFGTFKTSIRKARAARNPQNGAAVKVPRRRVARFAAGKALKNAVK